MSPCVDVSPHVPSGSESHPRGAPALTRVEVASVPRTCLKEGLPGGDTAGTPPSLQHQWAELPPELELLGSHSAQWSLVGSAWPVPTQGPSAACGPWTLEGTGLPPWEQDWAPCCRAAGEQDAGLGGSSPA